MTADEHAWLYRIEEKIDKTGEVMHAINANGCARAKQHDDVEMRLRKVEAVQAESKGKLAVFSALVASVATLACEWLGRRL